MNSFAVRIVFGLLLAASLFVPAAVIAGWCQACNQEGAIPAVQGGYGTFVRKVNGRYVLCEGTWNTTVSYKMCGDGGLFDWCVNTSKRKSAICVAPDSTRKRNFISNGCE